jgi:lysophospholipase L1-like esterase
MHKPPWLAGVLALCLSWNPTWGANRSMGHPQVNSPERQWAASWASAPAFAVGPEFANQTIRQTVRLSIGGSRIRLRFDNGNHTNPLIIAAAHVAMPDHDLGTIDSMTVHALTFNGSTSISVPAGAPIYSDPLDLNVLPLSGLTVSIFLTRDTGPSTIHPDGNATAFISEEGDHTDDVAIPHATTSTSRIFLTEVDVWSAVAPIGSLVTLGDSITDGAVSTLDRNQRWPDLLAERLQRQPSPVQVGVANAGIGGNRILHDDPELSYGPNALARLDRDVLSVPGLKWVILLEGINDIGHSTASRLPEQEVSAEEIISGMVQIIERVNGRGAKIFGGTLLPFEGTVYSRFYTPEGEQKRQTVNAWIRTSHNFDGVIDFDTAMRDPNQPTRLNPAYDSGDHIHPNDAGYQRMADAVDLHFFK